MTSQDVILGMLMKRGLTGYEIKHLLETIFSYFYNASYGTIYPTLSKMEKEGLITKESVLQEGRPNKNIFTITDLGKTHFKTYMNSPVLADEYKSDRMIRLYFGEFVEREVIISSLELDLARANEELERLEANYKLWQPTMSPTQEICIQIGIENTATLIQTLTNGLNRLKHIAEEKGDE
ncbi:PadR family transcriptional regulator [Paenibacillus sp. N3.4]|uniref:PadR family transcriptional regulator n=1 Tax=Paenibacillus sp. N3.4 TaxID=2603222 RepID=UPI0011CCBA01|nr:PadR family transcriptional regulator [Paenibacillus sp. N3.4]TXK76384.1 PadR family transcriptional regulator [Paenibacillus sp. N3.4]